MNEYEVIITSTMEVRRCYLVVSGGRYNAESVALRRHEEGDGEYTEETISESIREVKTKDMGEIE